ncbi:MAG: RES family NAD+ phosphorylase [Flavobacteriales bacterium]|nr:RES family NAD+ phosphorylase [Flavobacteriales bacterium]
MLVYRIERKKRKETTLSGIGASLSRGFRWNNIHTRMVYTSESRALSLLEMAVHLDLVEDIPDDRMMVEIDIPDSIEILEIRSFDLPSDWSSYPPVTLTKNIGDDFVKYGESAILKVPSAIIPEECNYLINPLHRDATKIKVVSALPLKMDKRLFSPVMSIVE